MSITWDQYKKELPSLDNIMHNDGGIIDDDDVEMASFIDTLPLAAADLLEDAADSDTDDISGGLGWESISSASWCLCETAEGEFPRVQIFPNVSKLCHSLEEKEGEDTAVWLFYGVPLQLTKPAAFNSRGETICRYLLLPGNNAVKIGNTEYVNIIPQSELPDGLELQDDGWLGESGERRIDFYTPGFTAVTDDDIDDDSWD